MTAKKTEFIVTDLISKICQRKTIMDKLPSQRELAEIYHWLLYTSAVSLRGSPRPACSSAVFM